MLIANKYRGRQYGQYRIECPIGEGRYGVCFLARSSDASPVIVKRFKPSVFKKNSKKNAFEAIVLSQLSHPAIPELLGVINEKGFYAFVLEYKPGLSVKELLVKQKHVFNKSEFFSIGLQLIDIIQYMHASGFVHRDIRISNVLIDQERIYLIDFGLARPADDTKYRYDMDFSYLGDFLLYLLYSDFQPEAGLRSRPWYIELPLSKDQILFIKKLLRLQKPYTHIQQIRSDFILSFSI